MPLAADSSAGWIPMGTKLPVHCRASTSGSGGTSLDSRISAEIRASPSASPACARRQAKRKHTNKPADDKHGGSIRRRTERSLTPCVSVRRQWRNGYHETGGVRSEGLCACVRACARVRAGLRACVSVCYEGCESGRWLLAMPCGLGAAVTRKGAKGFCVGG